MNNRPVADFQNVKNTIGMFDIFDIHVVFVRNLVVPKT